MTKKTEPLNNDQTINKSSTISSRPKIRLPYDYDEQKIFSILYSVDSSEENSLNTGKNTLQSEANDCDINKIVERAQQTGILASKHMTQSSPQYGDFYDVSDYKMALDVVRDAQSQFNALPASLRAEFENDPAQFLAGLDDPKTLQKMVDLGLATAAPSQKIDTTPPPATAEPVKTPETAPKGS